MIDVKLVRELRYGDGLSSTQVAAMLGVTAGRIRQLAPGYLGKVPNDRVRALFLASRLSAYEVARRVGWRGGTDRRGGSPKWDSSRVLRTLGLRQDVSGSKRVLSTRRLIDAETAGDLAEAMGFARWEALPDEDAA